MSKVYCRDCKYSKVYAYGYKCWHPENMKDSPNGKCSVHTFEVNKNNDCNKFKVDNIFQCIVKKFMEG